MVQKQHMSKTGRHLKKFTKEDDAKIKEYFETPEGEKIPIKEFAKSLNHSSRAVKERYKFYIVPEIEFSEEIDQKIMDSIDQYRINTIQWLNMANDVFKNKDLRFKIRDRYNTLLKREKRKTGVSVIKGLIVNFTTEESSFDDESQLFGDDYSWGLDKESENVF